MPLTKEAELEDMMARIAARAYVEEMEKMAGMWQNLMGGAKNLMQEGVGAVKGAIGETAGAGLKGMANDAISGMKAHLDNIHGSLDSGLHDLWHGTNVPHPQTELASIGETVHKPGAKDIIHGLIDKHLGGPAAADQTAKNTGTHALAAAAGYAGGRIHGAMNASKEIGALTQKSNKEIGALTQKSNNLRNGLMVAGGAGAIGLPMAYMAGRSNGREDRR